MFDLPLLIIKAVNSVLNSYNNILANIIISGILKYSIFWYNNTMDYIYPRLTKIEMEE